MSEKIYVIGHKSPDLDSVAAAVSYARLKNELTGRDEYEARISGPVNKLTDYVLRRFSFAVPEILEDAGNKKLILVDHNEASQIVEGGDKAELMEILDHHKMDFSYGEPIEIQVLPWGSTSSIISDLYLKADLDIDRNLAGLLLSAMLDDTVIMKSPTATKQDKLLIEEMAEIAEINDWQAYGMELFKIKSNVGDLSDEELIKNDYKDFKTASGVFGIGQVETVDLSEFKAREDSILKALEELRKSGGYHTTILFITDIMKGGSQLLVASSDVEKLEKAFNTEFENNRVYIDGIMSRKKQVAPVVMEYFDKK